jgi:tRNA nucleotidyltransferase/poly(A) polymerase
MDEMPEVLRGAGETPSVMKAHIEMPLDLRIIAELLRCGDPTVAVYGVGGFVRDYLFWKYHTDRSRPFAPKDYDMATSLTEEDIVRRLITDEAKRFCVRVKEKESVDTFGVVFVSVDGRGPYEVAPFRRDVGVGDGRHPDRVEVAPVYDDAMRRDFTINNLYYDAEHGLILDFNPNAQGFADVRAKVVRPVGDPFARFEEDKLRVLRMFRFFCRFNTGMIVDFMDTPTRLATFKYRNLRAYRGMSGERIETEFLLGLQQCLSPTAYLINYYDFDLFRAAVFPDLTVRHDLIWTLEGVRSPRVVLAVLLQDNPDVAAKLNALKYPNEIAEPVAFLIAAMRHDPVDAFDVLKARDRRLVRSKVRELTAAEAATNAAVDAELKTDLWLLRRACQDKSVRCRLDHLSQYQYAVPDGEGLMAKGYAGRQIGEEQRRVVNAAYLSSYRWWQNTWLDAAETDE